MKQCAKILTTSYEYMLTNAFIDGLNESYATLTRMSRPSNLNDAYQSAKEQLIAAQRRKERQFRVPPTQQKPTFKPVNTTTSWQNPKMSYINMAQNTLPTNRFPPRTTQNPLYYNRLPLTRSYNSTTRPEISRDPTFPLKTIRSRSFRPKSTREIQIFR